MTDIKIKRYADKENLKKLMKYSKDTFANKSEINEKFYTKEQIDTMLGESSGGTGGDYYTKSEIDTKLNSKANTSDLSTVAASGDYNDLINKPAIPQINDDRSWVISRDTNGDFFQLIHTGWSRSLNHNKWAGMYFNTSDGLDVFGFAARQTSTPVENFTVGNNGYLRGYDTNGNRTVTLVINGGTAGQSDTQNITVEGTFVNAGNQQPSSANRYTIGTSNMPYQAMYAGTFNTDNSSDSGLIASNSSTEHSLLFGIGGTGVNRGIYDNKNSRWSIYLNATDYIMTQCPTPPKGDSSNKLATTEWVQIELDSKANTNDLSNYYTKSEVDNLLGNISINSITNEEIERICVL